MQEKTISIFLFLLFLLIASVIQAYSKEMILSLDEVILLAKNNNSELKTLKFSYLELKREKLNLYRSLFPSISTSFSRAEILSYGEQDIKNYQVTLGLEQVVYNQFSFPMSIKNHNLAVKEAGLKIELKEKEIERQVSNMFMNIIILNEIIKNSEKGLSLHRNYRELMREEYIMGMKTLLDLVEAEKMVLENELELKKSKAERDILYRDLVDLICVDIQKSEINLRGNIDSIFSSILNVVEPSTFIDFLYAASDTSKRILSRKDLSQLALKNNLEIKKMNLTLAHNELKRKLISIRFLKNISLGYELDFTGERFFPANKTHMLSLNFLLDFGGIFSSETTLSETTRKSMKSSTHTSSSSLVESLDPFNEKRKLRIDTFMIQQNIKEKENKVIKDIDIWEINIKTMVDEFEILLKKENIFNKNEEIFKLKLELGEIRTLEYLEFLIQKNDFLIELEKIKYRFINLLWDLESILNMDIQEILRQVPGSS